MSDLGRDRLETLSIKLQDATSKEGDIPREAGKLVACWFKAIALTMATSSHQRRALHVARAFEETFASLARLAEKRENRKADVQNAFPKSPGSRARRARAEARPEWPGSRDQRSRAEGGRLIPSEDCARRCTQSNSVRISPESSFRPWSATRPSFARADGASQLAKLAETQRRYAARMEALWRSTASRQTGGSPDAAPRRRVRSALPFAGVAERAVFRRPEASLPDRIVLPARARRHGRCRRQRAAPAGFPDPPVHGCDEPGELPCHQSRGLDAGPQHERRVPRRRSQEPSRGPCPGPDLDDRHQCLRSRTESRVAPQARWCSRTNSFSSFSTPLPRRPWTSGLW